jgi:uncharacterized membrane protein YraQ (UPF0718 family)
MFQDELGSGCGYGIQKGEGKTFMENVKIEVEEIKTEEGVFMKNVKEFLQNVSAMFHKVGFWVLVLILIGTFIGGTAMTWYQKSQMNNAIMLGGFVYDGKVFDIKERIR